MTARGVETDSNGNLKSVSALNYKFEKSQWIIFAIFTKFKDNSKIETGKSNFLNFIQ